MPPKPNKEAIMPTKPIMEATMPTDIIGSKKAIDNQEIQVVQLTSGFCRMPDALFHIPEELGIQGWKARFIVGLSYLYALSFNKGKAITTRKELKKVLQTESNDTVWQFIKTVNQLTFLLKTRAARAGLRLEGGVITKTGRKGGTQCYLIDQTIIAEAFRHKVSHGGTFAFYNLSLLLPVSPQAKAILLYLHRKARGGSLFEGVAESTVSVRELKKVLSMGTSTITNGIVELEEAGVVERTKHRPLSFRIARIEEWDRNVLLNILHNWNGHPFLKDWELPVCSISYENCPIEEHKLPDTGTSENENCPIEEHKLPDTGTYRNTYRNKSKNRNKSMEYDANIYNGGGEKQNIRNLSNSEKEINREESSSKSGSSLSSSEKRSVPKKEPNGSLKKKQAAKLGQPNKTCKERQERVDRQELDRIKATLKALRPQLERKFPELFKEQSVESLRAVYGALEKYYGEDWAVLAAMYELMRKKKPELGYNDKSVHNKVGLLISYCLKDRNSSFWEMAEKFRLVFPDFSLRAEEESSDDQSAISTLRAEFDRLMEHLDKLVDSGRFPFKPRTWRVIRKNLLNLTAGKDGYNLVVKDRVSAELFERFGVLAEIEKYLNKPVRVEIGG